MRTMILSVTLMTGVMCASATLATGGGEKSQLVGIEAAWSKAEIAKDTATLDRIMAPDWIGQNPSGKATTRTMMLSDLTTGVDSVTSMTNHDVRVRIIGDIAIVQGADDEKSAHKGKSTSGTYTWTDVFQKRAGHWVAIASQVTPVAGR